MKLKPHGDRILVLPTSSVNVKIQDRWEMDEASTTSSIRRGVVEAVGSGTFDALGHARVPLEFNIGDVVLFGKYAGSEFKIGDDRLLLLRADEVLATLVPERH